MTTPRSPLRTAGTLFIRLLLGLIFFMQGYGKVFSFGVGRVYQMFFADFEKTFLPRWLLFATAYYTSYVEMAGGLLLIVGLFRKYALYLLALDLIIVSFGHGLLEPIWDLGHVVPRAIMLTTLFFLPPEWDGWSLDSALGNND